VVAVFTLYGYVRDGSGRPVVGARVFVVDGANANKASMSDGNGYYSIPGLVTGGFTLRVTVNNVFVRDFPVNFTGDRQMDLPVTTSSVPTTSTTGGGGGGGGGGCACDLVHYWYPN
jgi:carboxypeptidase family protein